MKQRIRVTAIIRNENGILVLKRSRGRSEAPVFWELPTAKINFGEQPEEAMTRCLMEYLEATPSSMTLKDVITFLALEDSSRLSNLYIVFEVTIPTNHKIITHDRYNAYKFIKDFSTSPVPLNEATISVLEMEEGKIAKGRLSYRETANSVSIYVDGASRGNPGPSGIGYSIRDQSGKIIEEDGEFIGFATSRVAEYYAIKKGIERALELGYKSVRFFSDSLMVVNQLNGIFRPKNRDILPIYRDVVAEIDRFDSVSFTHIPRTNNRNADAAANAAIDSLYKKS